MGRSERANDSVTGSRTPALEAGAGAEVVGVEVLVVDVMLSESRLM